MMIVDEEDDDTSKVSLIMILHGKGATIREGATIHALKLLKMTHFFTETTSLHKEVVMYIRHSLFSYYTLSPTLFVNLKTTLFVISSIFLKCGLDRSGC